MRLESRRTLQNPVTMASAAYGGHKYPSFDLFSDPPPPNLTPFQQQYVRDFDWASSPIGPVHSWPSQLRQLVNIIQRDTHGSCIYWDVPGDHGNTDVVILYNEAYTYLMYVDLFLLIRLLG